MTLILDGWLLAPVLRILDHVGTTVDHDGGILESHGDDTSVVMLHAPTIAGQLMGVSLGTDSAKGEGAAAGVGGVHFFLLG